MTAAVRPAGARRAPGRGRSEARPSDVRSVRLLGVVARPPEVRQGVTEFTLAGETRMPGGQVLPWYHKVRTVHPEASALVVAGAALEVNGELEHHKFGPVGSRKSLVRVRGLELLAVRVPEAAVLRSESEGGLSFRLAEAASVNEVRLVGNLTLAAELMYTPANDPYVRLNIAVEGEDHPHYFLLKAWRAEALKVGMLGRGPGWAWWAC